MKFKTINLSEVSQTNNNKYFMFPLICECTIYVFHMCTVIHMNTEVPTKGPGRRKDLSRKGKDIRLLQRVRMVKRGERWERVKGE